MAVRVGYGRGFDVGWLRFMARDSPLRNHTAGTAFIDISALSGTYTVTYDDTQ